MDDHLRLSDAERERAATDLGEHYAQGRLTIDEHAERLDRIWAARTRGELAPVFSDLPGRAAPAVPPERPRPPARRHRSWLLLILVTLAVLAVATHAPGLFLIPFVAVLVLTRHRSCSRRGT
jgi:ferric-dicitrate binding protein FerR (iron transport regulator)